MQGEIPARVLRRVVDQHQVRIAARFVRQEREVVIGPDVAIDRDEGLVAVAQEGHRIPHAAAGFQRGFALVDAMQVDAPAAAVAEGARELFGQPRGVDHDFADADRREFLDVPFDQRLATDDEQRLGRSVGERTHALAEARGEDQGFHADVAIAGFTFASMKRCNGANSGYFGSTASR